MKNRHKKFNILLISILLGSCNKEISGTWVSFVVPSNSIETISGSMEPPFNTSMSLKYFLDDKKKVDEDSLESLYQNEVVRLHKIFDRHASYKDENGDLVTNVKTINDSYGTGKEIECSAELYNLLKLGIKYYEITGGYFNIFTGSLTDYWDDIFNEVYNYGNIEEKDPYYNKEQAELLENLVSVIPNTSEDVSKQLTFNDEKQTVVFNKLSDSEYPVAISVGGIAKGYATDLIKVKLTDNGYYDGYLFSGGSSVTTLGTPIYTSEQGGQKLSVQNPEQSTFYEAKVAFSMKYTKEFSFSTSGNYTTEKNYRFEDKEGNLIYRHHIINPYTGYPMSYHRSVTICSSSFTAGELDALSTAFMNYTVEEGFAFRSKLLSQNPDYDLDLIYLDQEGYGDAAKVTAISANDVNNTLTAGEGVTLKIYEG